MKKLIVCGFIACVLAFAGCISVESTKAQLNSGDPAQIAKAKKNLIYIIGDGDDGTNGGGRFSLEERLAFLEIAPDNDVIMAAVEKALNGRYHSDTEVALAAIKKLKTGTKEDAAQFIKYTMHYNFDGLGFTRNDLKEKICNATDEAFAKAFALLDEQDTISLIKSDGEAEREEKILGPGDGWRSTALEEIWKYKHSRSGVGGKKLLLHLVDVAQSPDLLCKILLNKIIMLRRSKFDKDDIAIRQSVEARLLPKVSEISDIKLIEALLGKDVGSSYDTYHTETIDGIERLKYLSDTKLAVKLVARLPKASQEKLALDYIDRGIGGNWMRGDRIDGSLFSVSVAAAFATKDEAVKNKVANAMLKEIVGMPKSKTEYNLLTRWNDEDAALADKFVAQLVKAFGKEWFATAITGLGCMPDFVAKHLTPEIAVAAFEKGGIKSTQAEVALAKVVDGAKITPAIIKGVRSPDARKILEQKMPDNAKAQLAEDAQKEVDRILADANGKSGTTFVLGGFYVGMPMEDAYILIQHYAGKDRKVEKGEKGKCNSIALYGQKDWFAISFSDDKSAVREFNFGPWILRKFCDYDAQDVLEWAKCFAADKKYNMTYKYISRTGNVWIMDEKYPIALSQKSVQYKNAKQGFHLTYFGEREFRASEDLIEGEGPSYFADYSAAEGTLRIENYHD